MRAGGHAGWKSAPRRPGGFAVSGREVRATPVWEGEKSGRVRGARREARGVVHVFRSHAGFRVKVFVEGERSKMEWNRVIFFQMRQVLLAWRGGRAQFARIKNYS